MNTLLQPAQSKLLEGLEILNTLLLIILWALTDPVLRRLKWISEGEGFMGTAATERPDVPEEGGTRHVERSGAEVDVDDEEE